MLQRFQEKPSFRLVSRARQFSSFLLLVGKISGPNSFEPEQIYNSEIIDKEITHKETKVENDQYSCSECGKQYVQKGGLAKHIKTSHEGIKYSCYECSQVFTSRDYLFRHIKSIHEGIKFSCDLCDYKANATSNLYAHKRIKHP